MTAHYNKQSNAEQSLSQHSLNTAKLTSNKLSLIGFSHIGYLIGLLHDLGKGTERFNFYIHNTDKIRKGEIHHAPSGAIFAYEKWYLKASSVQEKITAQIIAMVIYGHHGGLMDVVSPDGTQLLSKALCQNKEALGYDEAVENFLTEVASEAELEQLFCNAVSEIRKFVDTVAKMVRKDRKLIFVNLLARLLLSALVDADRLDSACFEYGTDPFEPCKAPDWTAALASLENALKDFTDAAKIDRIRRKISDECLNAAQKRGSIFRLTVPTGGGKTFSSLRFALSRAVSDDIIRHIFYVIPFNTILDQNAHDIRDALGDTVDILEHHSNVVFDADDSDGYARYTRLTERWNSEIILTSMVQFMDSIYSGSNTDARRMSGIIGSILIFDEVQALPIKCRTLFECAVEFLAYFCGCTVLLCTATQPLLTFSSEPTEIISDVPILFRAMERVQFHDETKRCLNAEEAAERLSDLISQYGSVLMIVNTKPMAKRLYELMSSRVNSIHLSTGMYPEHRFDLIKKIKNRDRSEPFFCVSTSLIEAGINISFPCVVRSLAGLGSILQAAGRCNRSCEYDRGDVYIWQLEENLDKLPEIRASAEITKGLLMENDSIGSLETIERFFERERSRLPKLIAEYSEKKIVNYIEMDKFPIPELSSGTTIFGILDRGFGGGVFPINAAYRTAGEYFCVIDSRTRGVLVPEGRGAEIYKELCGDISYDKTCRLLREAGRYSVSLYNGMFMNLRDRENALIWLEKAGIYVLRDGWYDKETGIRTDAGTMSFLGY